MKGRRTNPRFRKIMVAYDSSKQAEKAVDVARELAGCMDAKLLILAVARPPEPATSVELEAFLDDAREHYEEGFKRIRERADEDEAFETAVVVGHPAEQIVHRAELEHADLIVLGNRGHSRIERLLLGSTSERVLRYAHCPVMIVR
jgi:nucleotide-binding universal stress UspA family protein